jgi:aryl-alcohol dehydrogenase-like predicted oxidoreductase
VEYRTLGRTGIRVSTHCLGAMMFGSWGNTDVGECVRMIHTALDAGINFIDTADVYSEGESEQIVGRALATRRDDAILATKVHGPMGKGVNQRGNSRLWIMREIENSLKRLGTDRIDLYQLHRPDPSVHIEETLEALTDLLRAGKVRYVGTSTFPGWQLVEAHWASERRNLVPFVCEQPPYSILVRAAERGVFPVTQRYGMGVIVWSPLTGGWLTGKYRRNQRIPDQSRLARYSRRGDRIGDRFDLSRPANQRKLDLVDDLAVVADKAGVAMTHMAMSFALAHPAVTSAIIGPRTPQQLNDLLAGADLRLDRDTLDAIDELVPPGTVVEEADRGWDPPWMAPEARRGGT